MFSVRILETGLFLGLIIFSSPVFAESVEESWVDPNYAFCEGIGAGASGKVRAVAQIERGEGFANVYQLKIETQHLARHIPTGGIKFKNAYGNIESVRLESAWFPELKRPDGGPRTLFLPRVRTEPISGPQEQMSISIMDGTEIEISLQLLFTADGGNCPTSFTAKWNLE